MTDGEWESLALPIDLAFFFYSTPQQKMTAMYPSPAGPTESLLTLTAWETLVRQNHALQTMEADVEKTPQSAIRQARLGLLYAYLGRKDEAIRAGRRASELQPESTDAYGGPHYASILALIYAQTGETDAALDLIERLLQTPGPVFYYEASMTLAELRLRWQWDPLRGNARFEKILATPEPKTAR